MRGSDDRSGSLFSYVVLETRVRRDRPLRAIREIANAALVAQSEDVAEPYPPRLASSDRFPVDGTLIEAWASIKSFRRKDGNDDAQGPDPQTRSATSPRRSGRARPMPARRIPTPGSTRRRRPARQALRHGPHPAKRLRFQHHRLFLGRQRRNGRGRWRRMGQTPARPLPPRPICFHNGDEADSTARRRHFFTRLLDSGAAPQPVKPPS